jgi:hypothetical protein
VTRLRLDRTGIEKRRIADRDRHRRRRALARFVTYSPVVTITATAEPSRLHDARCTAHTRISRAAARPDWASLGRKQDLSHLAAGFIGRHLGRGREI